MLLNTTINGQKRSLPVVPGDSLYQVLRDAGYLGVKKGCDTSGCGLCTVWLNGKPVLSCSLLALRAADQEVTTIEGVQEEAEAFARHMVAEGAEQCGFCSPGLTMTVLAMRRELSNPSEAAISHYLAGNLCRCSGYQGQLRAIKNFVGGDDALSR